MTRTITRNQTRVSFFVPKQCILNFNANIGYVFVDTPNKHGSWLVDTGALISVIKVQALSEHATIHSQNNVITGIGGALQSNGYTYITLRSQHGQLFEHKFHVFQNLAITSDGIIGYDFLKKNKANIDLESLQLTLKNRHTSVNIPIYGSTKVSRDYLTIPARSESIHYIRLNKPVTEDCVICS